MNFLRSFVLKGGLAAWGLAIAGCGVQDGAAAFKQGVEAFSVKDLKRAEKAFSTCIEESPTNVEAFVYLTQIELGLGDIASARKWIDKAIDLAGSDVDVCLLDAQVAWHAKDYDRALRLYTDLANDARLGNTIRAQAFTGVGIVEMTREKGHLARIAFLQAIRQDRHHASAWYHLGLLYRDVFGYAEAALEQFEIFVRLETMASVRVQKVQRSIIPALKDAIQQEMASRPNVSKRNSAVSAAALAAAETAWKKGAFKAARGKYQEALAADTLSFPAALGLARAWVKTDATVAGQSKALENYVIACKLRPSSVSTFLAAGALAKKIGRFAQSVEIYSRAVAASPSSFEALDGLIYALRKVGGKDDVAKAYQLYRESIPKRR